MEGGLGHYLSIHYYTSIVLTPTDVQSIESIPSHDKNRSTEDMSHDTMSQNAWNEEPKRKKLLTITKMTINNAILKKKRAMFV